jgi:uncharacterized protein YdhG (YjbR/CyaY superfamily)
LPIYGNFPAASGVVISSQYRPGALMKKSFESIDAYISSFPKEVQVQLQELRALISQCAPEATEKISYQMPTFYLSGNLVHFAAYSGHIGFYPTPSGVAAFEDELSEYQYSKGAIQFRLDEPLPVKLIEKIVKFRVKENQSKARKK